MVKLNVDIVVYVSGGNVQSVATNMAEGHAVRVVIVDYDNGRDVAPEDREKWGVHQLDDGAASVSPFDVLTAPDEVADIMSKAFETP